MYYLPTYCLVFFFLFSLFHLLPCSSSKPESCDETLFQCGHITAGFPFRGGNRHWYCGHPLLELHCFKNDTSIIISNHLYHVRHFDQKSKTLTLASAELQAPFCQATFTDTTLPPEIFELSSTYKSLTVFYLCDRYLSYRSSYTCPGRGPVSVSETLDYHNSCKDSFTINVPRSFVPEEKELNLTRLESALSEGFEVKVKIDEKACQECLSSNGTCAFNNTTQVCCKDASSSECSRLHQPDATELHTRCGGPFSCGDQKELFYPFWNSERENCGHPEFKVECTTSSAEVSISSVKFRILDSNYNTRVVRLARSDYTSGFCPQNPINAPFNENVLPFAPDTEMLTIYYNCSQDFSQFVSTYVGDLDDCEDYEGSNYYVTRNLSSPLLKGIKGLLNDFSIICSRNVSIPAPGPELIKLERSQSTDNLKKVLEEGFGLRGNQECSMCISSGGACGYNQALSKFVCYCIDEQQNLTCSSRKKGISHGAIAGIVATSGLVVVVLIVVGLFCLICCLGKTSDDLRKQKLKALIPLKHYSYAQVKRITKSFSEVVGKGGFGTVYRGTLCDGRSVAVKVLKESKGDGEDFINEVASMSKTSHVNIVSLLGFCSEGSKRAIIYEFVENGSLDKFMSSNTSVKLDWIALYGVALGVARGLEYLHYGCKTRIVHFDIKPSNVLVDKNLCPKLSDFGLAKLCEKKESIMSLLDTRGTIGYIAPEMISRAYGNVSHKSDVYSYGMLVLEMIGARNKTSTENSASNPSSMYFPEWIYRDLEKRDGGRPIENGISSEEEEISKKMTLVGLWCIQSSPSDRPPMNRVVEMMEGSLEALEVPPRPVLQQIPATPFQESSELSEDISVYTEYDIKSQEQ